MTLWLARAFLVFWMAAEDGNLSFECERVWGHYGGPGYTCPAGWSHQRCYGSFALWCPNYRLQDIDGNPRHSVMYCIGEDC